MVGGHEGVEMDDGQKVRLGLGGSSHGYLTRLSNICSTFRGFFNSLLV
jgi:hypothetical protein